MAIDLKIFEKLEEAHNAPVSLVDLLVSTGGDAALIGELSSTVPFSSKSLKDNNADYLNSQDDEASFGHQHY